jgi:hypothetical protein
MRARLRSLTFGEICRVVGIAALLALSSLAVRALPPRSYLGWVQRSLGSRPRPGEAEVRRLVRLVEAVDERLPGGAGCLRRSLVLCLLLRRRGVPATVELGVARRDGGIVAHAWLATGDPLFGIVDHAAGYASLRGRTRSNLLPT